MDFGCSKGVSINRSPKGATFFVLRSTLKNNRLRFIFYN